MTEPMLQLNAHEISRAERLWIKVSVGGDLEAAVWVISRGWSMEM